MNVFDMIHVLSDLMKSVVCNILGSPCVQQGQAAVVVLSLGKCVAMIQN